MALGLSQLPHPFSGMHCRMSSERTIHNFPYLYLRKNVKGLRHEDVVSHYLVSLSMHKMHKMLLKSYEEDIKQISLGSMVISAA